MRRKNITFTKIVIVITPILLINILQSMLWIPLVKHHLSYKQKPKTPMVAVWKVWEWCGKLVDNL